MPTKLINQRLWCGIVVNFLVLWRGVSCLTPSWVYVFKCAILSFWHQIQVEFSLIYTKFTIGFFVFNTNLTFVYKINIEGFKKFQQKIKLPPVGFELTTAAIRILSALPTQPPSHLLNRRSLYWSWYYTEVGSFLESIEHDLIRVLKFETGKERQIGWVGKAVRILIQWWLLLWVQIPLGATLFFC